MKRWENEKDERMEEKNDEEEEESRMKERVKEGQNCEMDEGEGMG